jgi:hypothetical protein
MDENNNLTSEEKNIISLPENTDTPAEPAEDVPQAPEASEQAEGTAAEPETSKEPPLEQIPFDSTYRVKPAAPKPPRRPFFRDTWEIFRHMFTQHAPRMLSIAAEDNYPIWRANAVVILLASLVSTLLSMALNSAFRALVNGYQVSLVITFTILSVVINAINLALIAVAVRVAAKLSGHSISWQKSTNVVTCCALVPAALSFVGSFIPVVGSLAATAINLVVLPILLYIGYQKLTDGEGHLWPFVWSMVLEVVAIALIAVIAVVLFLAGSIFNYMYYYF